MTPPGVVMGLSVSSLGGSALYIETRTVDRRGQRGGLKTSGRLGQTMRESADIAYTVAIDLLERFFPDNDFFHV